MTLLRLGFLFLLWAFVYFVVRVLKNDLYGTRITSAVTTTTGQSRGQRDIPESQSVPSSRPSRLVVVEGTLTGTQIPLASSAILIGRSPSCTLVLDDDYSSSRHARIFPQSDQWLVEDLGSTNGTYIGDERIQQPTIVPLGAPIRVGQSTFELQR